MTTTASTPDSLPESPEPAGRTTARDRDAEASIRGFVSRHPGGCVAAVDHVGRLGARIVVIADTGEFGDALATSVDAAHAVCAQVGIEVRSWDRELTGKISPTHADRVRMGSRQR